MSIVPAQRPLCNDTNVAVWLGVQRVSALSLGPVYLVGRRGYYRDSMGVVGKQDRGLYEDAMVLVTPSGTTTFNLDTAPSRFAKGIADLTPGVWTYKIGVHGLSKPLIRRYTALVQAAPVTVTRDGVPGTDTGYFGINIHKGGYTATSSLGCQTIYPDQWNDFIGTVIDEMGTHSQRTISYVLTERGGA